MSHEIWIRDGIAQCQFDEPAWHGLGEVLPNGITFTDTERLAFGTLHMRPTQVMLNGSATTIDGRNAVIRSVPDILTDSGVIAGSEYVVGTDVSDGYRPLPTSDFRTILFSQDVPLSSIGLLAGGSRSFGSFRMPNIGSENDPIAHYVNVLDSSDGSRPLMIVQSYIRVVCANTERFVISSAKDSDIIGGKVRHSGDLDSKVAALTDALSKATGLDERISAQIDAMRSVDGETAFAAICDYVAPIDEKASKTQQTRRNGVRDALRETFENERNSGGFGVNGWTAYNAFTEYVDHVRNVRGTEGDETAAAMARMGQAFDPESVTNREKANVAELVLSLA